MLKDKMDDVISESAPQCPVPELVDPFEGFFDSWVPHEKTTDRLIDFPLARRRLEYLAWMVRNDFYVGQQPHEAMSGARVPRNGRSYIMLSSCDYLGLIGHPAVMAGSIAALKQYGTGTGGVRLLTGSATLHQELEHDLASFLGVEAAMTYSSGYMANIGVLSGLFTTQSIVLIDALAHRSLVDGCRLSRATVQTFAHNDMTDLQGRLAAAPRNARIFILVDGLYSMDGDICPLPDIVELKKEFGAFIVLDEAHSFGVLGKHGRGVREHFGLPGTCVDVTTGSLSKAIPANGGFVAGRRDLIIYLQHAAAPFIFSAALCPAAVGAAMAALEVLSSEPKRVDQLQRNGDMLRVGLKNLGFDVGHSNSPLIPVIIGEDRDAYCLVRELLRRNVVVMPVVYPAVPKGSARLRLCATAVHRSEDIRTALDAFASLRPPARIGAHSH